MIALESGPAGGSNGDIWRRALLLTEGEKIPDRKEYKDLERKRRKSSCYEVKYVLLKGKENARTRCV